MFILKDFLCDNIRLKEGFIMNDVLGCMPFVIGFLSFCTTCMFCLAVRMLVKWYFCEDDYGKQLYQQASKTRFICGAFMLVSLILASTITYLSLSETWFIICSLVLLVDLVCIKISLFGVYHGYAKKAIERYEQGVDNQIEML